MMKHFFLAMTVASALVACGAETHCDDDDPACAECAAVPSCDEGETEHASESECPADASCRRVDLCGATIWCSSDGVECAGESPAGCIATGCPDGFECDTTTGGRPSACVCDAETGAWACTADLSGGVCIAVEDCAAVPTCLASEVEHARESECPADASCREVTVCGATIWCSRGAAICAGQSPAGCVEHGCPDGLVCDTTIGGRPSACVCDAETGSWDCTADLGGGECIACDDTAPSCREGENAHAAASECPADASCREVTTCGGTIWCSRGEVATCAGPSPEGCAATGCPEGLVCDHSVGARPSACTCDAKTGSWDCTADLSGGECVAR
jgi:hypothetical protein